MKEKLSKIKYFLPAEKMQSNLAIFLSIFALFFAVGNSNVPCLNADTCAVGSDEVFSGTVSIQNGTNYNLQLTGSPTANRVLTLPDNTGTVALTSDIPSVPSLTASKIMATDGTGAYSTTDIYPLSVGTTGQVLTVNSLATALEYSSITGVPSLTASKSVATDGTGALTTTDVYPLTLTASKVAKTDSSGNLTTGTIDITTDITAGTSLQQIRTNAGGTALEYFTPSGGGQWSLVASGHSMEPTTAIDGGTASHDVLICWGGASSTDGTDGSYFRMTNGKQYKLVVETLKSPYVNLHNTSGYNGHGFGYLSDGYDCGNGTTCTNCSGSNGYANTLPSWYYHNTSNSWSNSPYYGQNDDRCYILANVSTSQFYGIQGFNGVFTMNGFGFNWQGSNRGIKSTYKMNIPLVSFVSNYALEAPAFSEGVCMNFDGANQGGNSMYEMSDVYGMYFYNYGPNTNTANSDQSLLYWLYESNDYSNP